MKIHTSENYEFVTTEKGEKHCTWKVLSVDEYGAEAQPGKIIFFRNGIYSKPLKIVFDPEFIYSAKKTIIKSLHTAEELVNYLDDQSNNVYLRVLCENYCK